MNDYTTWGFSELITRIKELEAENKRIIADTVHHAKSLGSLGGKASAQSLTKEQRIQRAIKAVRARESKRAETKI